MSQRDLKNWLSEGELLAQVKSSLGYEPRVEVSITAVLNDYHEEGGKEYELPPLSKDDFYTLIDDIEFVMGWEGP